KKRAAPSQGAALSSSGKHRCRLQGTRSRHAHSLGRFGVNLFQGFLSQGADGPVLQAVDPCGDGDAPARRGVVRRGGAPALGHAAEEETKSKPEYHRSRQEMHVFLRLHQREISERGLVCGQTICYYPAKKSPHENRT